MAGAEKEQEVGPGSPAGREPSGRLERPIETEDQDRFGRAIFARRLADALVTPDGTKARGVVIGLTGPWGSGKTSTLNLVARELASRAPKPVVVRFQPWLISGRDDLIRSLLVEMSAALKRDLGPEKVKKFLDAAGPYLAVLGRVADVVLPGSKAAIDQAKKALDERLKDPTDLLALKSKVEAALRGLPCPVVVLIDELDRLPDDEIRTVAQLVRAVADFRHVSYVLAYDEQRLEEALGAEVVGGQRVRRQRGRAYLEKLVHIPIQLPVALAEEVAQLLEVEIAEVLAENSVEHSTLDGRRGRALRRLLTEEVMETPREVLRATSSFRVLLPMVGAEVDAADLLAFSVLHTRYPHLTRAMREAPGRFVFGFSGARDEMSWLVHHDGKNEEKQWAFRFPGVDVPSPARRLISFIFDDPAPDLASEISALTLRNRRPFLITLRLGLPPGVMPLHEAKQLFRMTGDEAAEFLARHRTAGTLPDLLDRLQEIYPLARDPSDAFWLPALDLLRRPRAAWRPVYDPMREVAFTWAHLGSLRLKANPADAGRFARISRTLLEKRDPHLLPRWLQAHVLAYGLFGMPMREDLRSFTFLDQATLRAWMVEQAAWVRNAFIQGNLLFELHHPHVLHQLADTGEWDETCRRRMKDLLSTPAGVEQLSLLLFGGNVTTEKKDVAKLVEPAWLARQARQRLAEVSGDADPTLSAALEKCADLSADGE